jgi:apolipoprotein N-acyltransferase
MTLLARLGLALLGGFLLFAGHPPLDLGWTGPLALVPLLALGRAVQRSDRPVRAGLGWGLVAGIAFFAPLLYWIGRFGIVPLALLVLIQGAFVAAFVGGLAAWGPRRAWPAVAVVWWVALEAVRGSWPLGGFTWGILGYTQHLGGPLLPIARSLGVLGVSAACAAVAALVHSAVTRVRADRAWWPAGAPALGAVALLLLAPLLGGPRPAETDRTIDLAGVQGNDEELPPIINRDDVRRMTRIVDLMVEATEALAEDPPELTVWPENSLDTDLRGNPALQERVVRAIELVDGGPLLAGELLDGPRPRTFYNGLALYGPGAELIDVHLKRNLVPFGEYVPLRRWLEWYPALRYVPNDGVAGDVDTVLQVAGVGIGPVTCYESIYPDLVRAQVREGAEVLVVSTNNASYGRTAASAQHVAFSRLRAVETGRWVFHVGISGISAVVDPEGRSSQETPLFERALIRADLPAVTGHTLYTRLGDVVGTVSMVLAALGLGWVLVERIRARRAPVI